MDQGVHQGEGACFLVEVWPDTREEEVWHQEAKAQEVEGTKVALAGPDVQVEERVPQDVLHVEQKDVDADSLIDVEFPQRQKHEEGVDEGGDEDKHIIEAEFAIVLLGLKDLTV